MSRLPEKPSLNLEAIEWRPQGNARQVGDGHKCRWVAYLQATTVAALFDEWVGSENWSDSYTVREFRVDGQKVEQAIECTISVRVPGTDEWVSHTDIGVFSDMEAVKGGYSDAFKRCGTLKWGMGRIVYELPTLVAECWMNNKGKIGGMTDRTEGQLARQLSLAGYDGVPARVSSEVGDGDDPQKQSPEARPRPASAAQASLPADDPRTEAGGSVGLPAPSGPVSAFAAFNELASAAKQSCKKELEGEGLWPLGKLDGEDNDAAVAIVRRFEAAVKEAAG